MVPVEGRSLSSHFTSSPICAACQQNFNADYLIQSVVTCSQVRLNVVKPYAISSEASLADDVVNDTCIWILWNQDTKIKFAWYIYL